MWNYELLDEGNGICFTCTSHDGEGGYPGQVNLNLKIYHLINYHIEYCNSICDPNNLSSNNCYHLLTNEKEEMKN